MKKICTLLIIVVLLFFTACQLKPVTESEAEVLSVEIVSYPAKISYLADYDEKLVLKGGKIKIVDSSGNTKELAMDSDEVKVDESISFNQKGVYVVTLSVDSAECCFAVEILDPFAIQATKFISDLQKDIEDEDISRIANRMHYPLNVYKHVGKEEKKEYMICDTKEEFIKNYNDIFTEELKKEVLSFNYTDPDNFNYGWQGIAIGGDHRNLWLDGVCNEDDSEYQVMIYTINC